MFNWLKQLDQHVPVRYSVWLLGALGVLVCAVTWALCGMGSWLALVFLLLVGLGVRNTRQMRHSVLRNYPVIGHFRRPRRSACTAFTRTRCWR